mgnify:FL=1
MTRRNNPKISKVNDRSLYGKTPLESWTGTVVSFDSQKEQLEEGWGWRYRVRIMGENTQSDTIPPEKLDYAYCLLPTTAGSGGAYKLRSVRISQGDYVFGVKGGGGPTIIIGVMPRTSKQVPGTGNFENLSGFYGSLKNTGILSGEFNEQLGPQTPGLPSNIDKSNRAISQREVESVGVDPSQEGVITNAIKKPPTTEETQVYEGNVDESGKREPLGFDQFKYILKNLTNDNIPENIEDIVNQAKTQFPQDVSEDTAKQMIKFIRNGEGKKAFELLELDKTPINEII